ncbi:hypothetical protein BpHYR1_025284 [Brachionus plicatilis]|uniref:Uncharacterized protein n=1 Tax=Brachionus plicatilis TaxID=10195 RepID=A0A3M7R4X3_BRAPC|nr:hypothetical protein BpHYR1_025284 [Brachionus plicatilis]
MIVVIKIYMKMKTKSLIQKDKINIFLILTFQSNGSLKLLFIQTVGMFDFKKHNTCIMKFIHIIKIYTMLKYTSVIEGWPHSSIQQEYRDKR